MNYAHAIKRLRLERRMTQAELAAAMSLTQGAIAHLEAGRNTPSRGTLELAARAFGVSLSELVKNAELVS